MTPKLRLNETYTRAEIHEIVGGGSLQSYLPTRRGRVLCACIDPELNPDAPGKILPGNGPIIVKSACQLVVQAERLSIPVFLKQSSNHWKYVGHFCSMGASTEPGVIAREKARSRRQSIAMVVYLREAEALGVGA